MALRVYRLGRDSICVSSDHGRVVISERMLDNDTSLRIHGGSAGNNMELLATIIPPARVGDIINGSKIIPRPGMVAKNVSNQQVLQYLLWEIADDKPIYHWQIPGTIYSLAGLDDDNYKILDLGEIDD